MEMATPRLGAVFESYAALSRKILKINLDFFPSFSPKISAAVVSRRCVRDRKRVELFNFEKWTGKAGKAREREKKRLFPSIFVFSFIFFSIQRKSVAVIEKLLEVLVEKKKLKGKHSQKVNSFSTFICSQRLIQWKSHPSFN